MKAIEANGARIPLLGLGTWDLRGKVCARMVDEAIRLADRIAIMKDGAIEQIGTPVEIYRDPATAFVADFIGTMNFVGGAAVGVAGAVVILTWLIEPLREIWPWFLELPWPIRVGLSLAGVGLVILMSSLIWERIEEREHDRSLLDDS